jgi:pseudouridine-5'-phosphate glycosidase
MPDPKKISHNAISRVLALQASALKAAQLIQAADGYSDFFVEGGGGSWHEAFGDVVTISENVDELSSLYKNVGARAAALSKSSVVQAYATLKAGGFTKQ